MSGMTNTYTNRSVELTTVKRIDRRSDGTAAVTAETGWTAGASAEVASRLYVGKDYGLETVNFSRVTGWLIDGEWFDRKSDADLDREHREFVAASQRRRREELEANRADWQARQDALPEWARVRVEHFHATGGESFALEGWGYELAVVELAVLYAASGGKDDATIDRYAREQGTSGNQHGMAKALASVHLADAGRSMAGTISALSPITGDAFYEKA